MTPSPSAGVINLTSRMDGNKMKTQDIQKTTGIVFNIQKYSVHDGPGIRTVVFLKGCPLSCKWCSNPESQSFAPQLAYNRKNCITSDECGKCHETCTEGALTQADDKRVSVDWAACSNCLACTEVCPAGALIAYGEEQNVKEVIDAVEKDANFYARSGGGLTLSGGEPFAQPKFALALLKEAKRRYIKTAIETCGVASREALLEGCNYCNTLLYDIKSMDALKHEQFTGYSNEVVLSNFKAVREAYPNLNIRVRTPIIPGFNDTEEEIRKIVEFISDYDVEYELLPYHRLGTQKYENTGREYPLGDVSLDNETFLALKAIADEFASGDAKQKSVKTDNVTTS